MRACCWLPLPECPQPHKHNLTDKKRASARFFFVCRKSETFPYRNYHGGSIMLADGQRQFHNVSLFHFLNTINSVVYVKQFIRERDFLSGWRNLDLSFRK